jgi:hypothetical protein
MAAGSPPQNGAYSNGVYTNGIFSSSGPDGGAVDGGGRVLGLGRPKSVLGSRASFARGAGSKEDEEGEEEDEEEQEQDFALPLPPTGPDFAAAPPLPSPAAASREGPALPPSARSARHRSQAAMFPPLEQLPEAPGEGEDRPTDPSLPMNGARTSADRRRRSHG